MSNRTCVCGHSEKVHLSDGCDALPLCKCNRFVDAAASPAGEGELRPSRFYRMFEHELISAAAAHAEKHYQQGDEETAALVTALSATISRMRRHFVAALSARAQQGKPCCQKCGKPIPTLCDECTSDEIATAFAVAYAQRCEHCGSALWGGAPHMAGCPASEQ